MRFTAARLPVFLLLLAASSRALAAGEAIEIRSPREYQVFQRESRAAGRVHVEGRLAHEIARTVEIRVVGTPADGALPSGWKRVDVEPSGTFAADPVLPAGGWYEMDVHVIHGGHESAFARVAHFGVGEVFVVAGQSNSTNYGSEPQKPQSGLVASFDGTDWRIADDPQPGAQDRGHGGSFMPAFGDALARRFGVPVGVACCGSGATSVRQWLPAGTRVDVPPTTDRAIKQLGPHQWECTGQLYEGLVNRMRSLGPRGFRAVLWHQGESDAGQAPQHQITGERYRALLEQVIHDARKDAGWDVPWFVAQATYHSAKDPANAEFRAAQKGVCDDGVALSGPDTDALGPAYRAGVHFNPAGLRAHGQLWADKVGAYLERVLADGPATRP